MKDDTSDLFNWKPPAPKPEYPDVPGFKKAGTSEAAAEAIKPRAPTLRNRALAELERIQPAGLTPDQVARRMGCSVLSIRPRMTELFKLGLIEPTGERRPNASGIEADVWRVADVRH